MKIIDEKGRLFGRINVIDFLLLVLLLGLLPIVYYGHKLAVKPPAKIIQEVVPEPKYLSIELNFRLIGIESGIVPQITVGDREVDAKGAQIGEILWLGEAKPYQHSFNLGVKADFVVEDHELKEIPAKIKINVRTENDSIFYKDKRIALNSPISFKSAKYTIEAIPVLIEKQADKCSATPIQNFSEKKNINYIEVNFSGIAPELANELAEGDIEKDSKNKAVSKLEKIISRKISEVIVYDQAEKKFILVTDPFIFDIRAVFKIPCYKQNGTWYFKDHPVRIGDSITFDMDKYSIKGTIVSMDIK